MKRYSIDELKDINGTIVESYPREEVYENLEEAIQKAERTAEILLKYGTDLTHVEVYELIYEDVEEDLKFMSCLESNLVYRISLFEKEYSQKERDAMKKVLSDCGYREDCLEEDVRNGYITISECRDDRRVVWAIYENIESCRYVDTLEELTEEEIEEQLL